MNPTHPLTRRHILASCAALVLPDFYKNAQAAPASTYARRVLQEKPCGYWRLGEKAGLPSAK